MISPFRCHLNIRRNRAYSQAIIFYTDEEETTPYDFTGRTMAMQIREKADPGYPVIMAPAVAYENDDPTTGTLIISLTQAETTDLLKRYDNLFFDIMDTYEDINYVEGTIRLIDTVSREA